jgi:hypothetical protein
MVNPPPDNRELAVHKKEIHFWEIKDLGLYVAHNDASGFTEFLQKKKILAV